MSKKYSKSPKDLGVPNLYQKADGGFHYKFTVNGVVRPKKLDAITKTMAKKEAEQKQAAHNAARNDLKDSKGLPYADPFAEASVEIHTTCGAIREAWKAAGCPSFGTVPQPLQAEKRETYLQEMSHAVDFFKDVKAKALTLKLLDDFFAAMLKGKPTSFARTVDKSLAKLSALLTWAVRREIIGINPIRTKVKYRNSDDVIHCTAYQPRSDEELHQLGRYFLESGRVATEALGWQMLFEAHTGCRTGEILAMRMDAAEGSPGFVNWALGSLYIQRLKHGINPFVLLEQKEGIAPLVDLIKAHREWHRARFGGRSPWYFPNRDGSGHLGETSLVQGLKRATAVLGLPKRTSHGMRAFYVRTARSIGLDDTEIAIRLGHRSGTDLVQKTYGVAEPNWRGKGLQDWVPEPVADTAHRAWLGTYEGTYLSSHAGNSGQLWATVCQ